MVVAVDGSAADEPVVDWAADEAARLGAPLRLVTVVDPQVQLSPYEALVSGAPSLAQHLEEGAHRILDRAVDRARARRDDVRDVATAVPWGPPAAALVRLSETAARVVVGAPGTGPPRADPAGVGRPSGRRPRPLPGRRRALRRRGGPAPAHPRRRRRQ